MLAAAMKTMAAVFLSVLVCGDTPVFAHPHHHQGAAAPPPAATPAPPGTIDPAAKGVSGTGALRFRVLLTSASLPEEARRVLVSAHGGFAVDHRPGKEETYFSLPGAGILRLGADLKQIALVPTAAQRRGARLHDLAGGRAPRHPGPAHGER